MSSNSTLASDARRVAAGGQPAPFDQVFEHHAHGSLRFRVETLPTALTLAAHSVAIDNLLSELVGDARAGTMILVAAIAGLQPLDDLPGRSLFCELPVVDEQRSDDDASGQGRIARTYYDARAETNVAFLAEVWTAVTIWRQGLISPEGVDAIKGPSGETSSPA